MEEWVKGCFFPPSLYLSPPTPLVGWWIHPVEDDSRMSQQSSMGMFSTN